MEHQGLRSGEPAQCLNPEPLVARPSDEGVWQPMRPDIGRPCQGTAISMASSHKQGMATLICREARNDLHFLTLLDLHLVHPKQGGPWCVEPRHRWDETASLSRRQCLQLLRSGRHREYR